MSQSQPEQPSGSSGGEEQASIPPGMWSRIDHDGERVVVEWEQDAPASGSMNVGEAPAAETQESAAAASTGTSLGSPWYRRSGSALGFHQNIIAARPALPAGDEEQSSSEKWVHHGDAPTKPDIDRGKWVRKSWPSDSGEQPPDVGDEPGDDGDTPKKKPWRKRRRDDHQRHRHYDHYYYDDYYTWYSPGYGYYDWWHYGTPVYYDHYYSGPDYYDTYYYTQQYDGWSPGYSQSYRYEIDYPYYPPNTPPALGEALRDIALSWLVEDISLASSHMSERMSIEARDERTGYERLFSAEELTDLIVVAFENVETEQFRFTDVEMQGDGQAWAEALHVYADENGRRHTAYIHYHLLESYGEWYVDAIVVKKDTA